MGDNKLKAEIRRMAKMSKSVAKNVIGKPLVFGGAVALGTAQLVADPRRTIEENIRRNYELGKELYGLKAKKKGRKYGKY